MNDQTLRELLLTCRDAVVRATTQLESITARLTHVEETMDRSDALQRIVALETTIANLKWLLGMLIPLAIGGGAAAGILVQ